MEDTKNIKWTLGSVLSVALIMTANALSFEDVMEGGCEGMPNRTTSAWIDTNWIRSTRRWFLSGGSKFYLYRATLHHFHGNDQVFAEIPEHKFYYESCLQLHTPRSGVGTWVVTGYEPGLQSLYDVREVSPGVHDLTPRQEQASMGRRSSPLVRGVSRHHIVLTDNRSFYLWTTCFGGPNQKAWGVYSTTPTLSMSVQRQIEDYLKEEGYDPEQFAFLRFNSCRPGVLGQNVPDVMPTRPTSPPTTSTTTTTTQPSPPGGNWPDEENFGWDSGSFRGGKF